MSAPKIIIQIAITGAQIFGRALLAAGRQAVKNAQHRPQAIAGDAAGVGNATSSSATDQLTRAHKMTLDEARLILNMKREDSLAAALKNYEHLFKANSPPPPPEGPVSSRARKAYHSHYLQSKVVRAKERLEAEHKIAEEAAEVGSAKPQSAEGPSTQASPSGQPPHPPPPS